MIRAVAFALLLLGTVTCATLAQAGHPAFGLASLVASACAALVVSVTAFVREPGDWPDDLPRFPPD